MTGSVIDKQKILDQIKIMAMSHGLRFLANDLDKAYSSLSNELDERDWAKLGLRTALSMLEIVLNSTNEQSRRAAINVLDMIDDGFNRIAYTIEPASGGAFQTMLLVSQMSKEFGENVECMARSLEDGKWTCTEVEKCRKENRDLIRACLQVEHYFQELASKFGGNNNPPRPER